MSHQKGERKMHLTDKISMRKVFLRMMNFECVSCERSLKKLIMENKIKIHFCRKCKLKFLKELG